MARRAFGANSNCSIVCTVVLCGAGIHTRNFFVPVGTSDTLPVYSIENFNAVTG